MDSPTEIKEKAISNFMTYNGNHLFHYTKFDSSIKIISSRSLLFGDFQKMNDIAESYKEIFDDVLKKELSMYRSISLTWDSKEKRGFAIDSLWGYYAEKGNGVCLVFDRHKLLTAFRSLSNYKYDGKIKYIKDFTNVIFLKPLADLTSSERIKKIRDIFFTKQKDWERENEYRLLIKTSGDHEVKIDFGNSLVAIIICMPLQESITSTCEYKILRKLTDVPILRYGTSLGNKELIDIEKEEKFKINGNEDNGLLWPIIGVDCEID